MTNVDVVIPSYGRVEKLKRTLASVHTAMNHCGARIDVHVFFSDLKEYKEASKDMQFPWLSFWMLPEGQDFRAPLFWNNYLRTMYVDALVYLTDDIRLDQYCLLIAINEIEKMKFDGVIGFNIDNKIESEQPCKAAFGIIGKEFAERFPGRAVFCPDYYSLFSDVELQQYAEKIGKFKFHTACKLVHYHPGYESEEMDATHMHTRRRKEKEVKIFSERQEKGLIWGESFELINKED